MSFTKLQRLINFARPPARLPLSKLPTKHPHVTGEQHLGIIPHVSLGSSLDLINLPCFSCFSTPAEDLGWSRGTCKFSDLSTWHLQCWNDPHFVPLPLPVDGRPGAGHAGFTALCQDEYQSKPGESCFSHTAAYTLPLLGSPSQLGHRWTPLLVRFSEQFLSFSI